MQANESLSDDTFVAAFEDLSLDPKLFNHLGHLRLGWYYLTWLPLPKAVQRCSDGIRRFATHHGAPEKFHLTMTLAFMHIVRERMREALPGENFDDFCTRNPELLHSARAVIARYYSEARLNDPAAKFAFLEPDRMPLP